MTYFRKVSQIQHLIIERAELLCCTGYSFSEDIIIPCNSFEMKILCIYLILMPSRICFQTLRGWSGIMIWLYTVYYYSLQVQITHAKFQFYILKQQKNACSIENVYSNAELELIQQATV